MKKILLLFLLAGIGIFPSCEGPEGPQGPPGQDGLDGVDGLDGEDGISLLNLVLEVEVDFTEENDFAVGFPFEINPDDNLLVFLEWAIVEENSLWRALPQNIFFPEGAVLTYNYQFTSAFLNIFMEGNFPLTELEPEWTDAQYLRIVYLPGYFLEEQNARVDLTNFDAVMKYIGKEEKDIIKLEKK